MKGKRDQLVNALTDAGVQSRPLASGNWLEQPVLAMQQHVTSGTFNGANEIEKEGFFVGNGVQDVSKGIDVMYDTIQTLL